MNAPPSIDILLVEDDPNDAEMTLRVLHQTHAAHQVLWLRDGAAALDYLFNRLDLTHVPKVVLLDIKMPKVNGIELLARIKASSLRSLPVVMLTSSDEESDVCRCYELGANSYLVKPLDYNAYSDTVKQASIYWLAHNLQAPVQRKPT